VIASTPSCETKYTNGKDLLANVAALEKLGRGAGVEFLARVQPHIPSYQALCVALYYTIE